MMEENKGIPEPIFIGGGSSGNPFIPTPVKKTDEDPSMYRSIMWKITERIPDLNPLVFYASHMSGEEVSLLNESDRNEEFKKQGTDLFEMIRKIFENEDFMCEISDVCDCDFMDIFKCLYSYYGNLIFKKPQFSRWMKKTVVTYSDETKRYLSIPIVEEDAEN